jgi:hypothetical protein
VAEACGEQGVASATTRWLDGRSMRSPTSEGLNADKRKKGPKKAKKGQEWEKNITIVAAKPRTRNRIRLASPRSRQHTSNSSRALPLLLPGCGVTKWTLQVEVRGVHAVCRERSIVSPRTTSAALRATMKETPTTRIRSSFNCGEDRCPRVGRSPVTYCGFRFSGRRFVDNNSSGFLTYPEDDWRKRLREPL